MKSDGPVILALVCLACGLTVIFYYGVGTGGFNAAYPFSAANFHMSINIDGAGAVGGLALVALGALLMVWAFLCALVGQFSPAGSSKYSPDRVERKRLEQEEKLARAERKRLEQQTQITKQEERLQASYPRD